MEPATPGQPQFSDYSDKPRVSNKWELKLRKFGGSRWGWAWGCRGCSSCQCKRTSIVSQVGASYVRGLTGIVTLVWRFTEGALPREAIS